MFIAQIPNLSAPSGVECKPNPPNTWRSAGALSFLHVKAINMVLLRSTPPELTWWSSGALRQN